MTSSVTRIFERACDMCDNPPDRHAATPDVRCDRNERVRHDWACAGAWCCLGATLILLTPFPILDALARFSFMPPRGKPWDIVLADTVGNYSGHLLILPIIGLLLAYVSMRRADKSVSRACKLATLLNLAALATFFLAAATVSG